MLLLFLTERWPLQNASTHSFAFFSLSARKLFYRDFFPGITFFAALLNLAHLIKEASERHGGKLDLSVFSW